MRCTNQHWVTIGSVTLIFLFSGCNTSTFSDGTIEGIADYQGMIKANINVFPNRGPAGTPVLIEIDFTQGGNYINSILEYDAVEERGYVFYRNDDLVYRKVSDNRWRGSAATDGAHTVLTGRRGVVRFYGITPNGTYACVGDAYANGATASDAPAWWEDGIGKMVAYVKELFGDDSEPCLVIESR